MQAKILVLVFILLSISCRSREAQRDGGSEFYDGTDSKLRAFINNLGGDAVKPGEENLRRFLSDTAKPKIDPNDNALKKFVNKLHQEDHVLDPEKDPNLRKFLKTLKKTDPYATVSTEVWRKLTKHIDFEKNDFLVKTDRFKFCLDYKSRIYSLENAYTLAVASAIAYARAGRVQKFYRVPNDQAKRSWVKSTFIQAGNKHSKKPLVYEDTQAYFLEHENFKIIAVRGTEPKAADFKTDLARFPKRKVIELDGFGVKKVHSGFYGAAMVIWKKVVDFATADKRPLFVTGHSLGAAIATVLAGRLSNKKWRSRTNLAGLYTYGSPRVGGANFRRMLHKQMAELKAPIIRIRNKDDLVTRVASMLPVPMIGNYKHVGTLYHINRLGSIVTGRKVGNLKQDILFPPALDLFSAVSHHSMEHYVSALKGGIASCVKPTTLK